MPVRSQNCLCVALAFCDLKAVNPHCKTGVDSRTPTELVDLVDDKGIEIAKALNGVEGSRQRKR